MRKMLAITSLFTLIGAGCLGYEPPSSSPPIAAPIQSETIEEPIAQRSGFGDLPPVPAAPRRPGAAGTVRILTELPSIAPRLAVLRIRSGNPNSAELRNIAQALQLPQGAMGRTPTVERFAASWDDGQGFVWTYDGSNGSLAFERPDLPPPADADAPLEDEELGGRALGFLRGIGVDLTRIGNPYRDGTASQNGVAVIRFNAMQDGQGVWAGEVTAVIGATVELNQTTGDVRRGSFLVRQDPDRSDYPAVPINEAHKRLAAGGLGGTPSGDVTITALAFEWLLIDQSQNREAVYLYPALVGMGTVRFADGRTAPHRIIVPLIADEVASVPRNR